MTCIGASTVRGTEVAGHCCMLSSRSFHKEEGQGGLRGAWCDHLPLSALPLALGGWVRMGPQRHHTCFDHVLPIMSARTGPIMSLLCCWYHVMPTWHTVMEPTHSFAILTSACRTAEGRQSLLVHPAKVMSGISSTCPRPSHWSSSPATAAGFITASADAVWRWGTMKAQP